MIDWSEVLFWLGVVGMVDGALGLLWEDRFRKLELKWNVRRVALVEIAVSTGLLAASFAAR